MSSLQQINAEGVPRPGGPYSHAIRSGGIIFVSGQLPINPGSGHIEAWDIREQTRQVLANLRRVLEAAGSDLEHVVRVTVYLRDKKRDFAAMNEVYAGHFPQKPARTTIEVGYIKELPLPALVEMDVIAVARE